MLVATSSLYSACAAPASVADDSICRSRGKGDHLELMQHMICMSTRWKHKLR